uniref:HMA domain-containing protein n=1 Tax=Aegilops tauschii subsp. strangulata TaxID=200361 RepID=A0A453C687_AEGTS
MKQKMVIRVHMTCDKCRSKAMGLVASIYGELWFTSPDCMSYQSSLRTN